MLTPTKPLRLAEFIVMLAFMVSIVAMAFGFSVGQLVVGPISDTYGRKQVIFVGYFVFVVGCILSISSADLATMLTGRFLQGVGAAAPRIVSTSLIRDGYVGRAMARIMSIIMSVFILVPAIAPSIGQGVILVLPWRYTFVVLLAMAVVAAVWFGVRQPETLARENRRALSLSNLVAGTIEVLSIRTVFGYTISMGFIFGAFLSYLGASRQIFQDALNVGDMFAIYFGVAALALGAASLLNSMLVMRLGMRLLTHWALVALVLLSGAFFAVFQSLDGQPSVSLFMAWQLAAFFCVGILFGNLNALAMEPLGHIAGLGATVLPLVGGFFSLGLAALIAARWTERALPFRVARR
jgi:DHA1 family bicyclomycin/chloramphenicol resistance-like MFS transporter